MQNALALIKARRAEIARNLDQLQAEDRDLATAEEVFSRLAELPATNDVPAPLKVHKSSGRRSQRAFVMDLLSQSDQIWFSSNEIVSEVQRLWGAKIPERSLRPLLSALKREQVLARSGRSVALRVRLREQRPKRAGAQPEI